MSYQDHIKMLDEHIIKQKKEHDSKIDFHLKVNKKLLNQATDLQETLTALEFEHESLKLAHRETLQKNEALKHRLAHPWKHLLGHVFRTKWHRALESNLK